MANDHTRPSADTRSAEAAEAAARHEPDRPPTPDEEARADELSVDPGVARNFEEAAERGANQKGEGRIP